MIRLTTRPGEWIAIDYPGDPLEVVFLAFGDTPEGPLPAFHEAGKAMVRCPNLDPGTYFLWAIIGGRGAKVGRVKVTE